MKGLSLGGRTGLQLYTLSTQTQTYNLQVHTHSILSSTLKYLRVLYNIKYIDTYVWTYTQLYTLQYSTTYIYTLFRINVWFRSRQWCCGRDQFRPGVRLHRFKVKVPSTPLQDKGFIYTDLCKDSVGYCWNI